MATDKPEVSTTGSSMKSKILVILLSVAVILAIGANVFLWSAWQKAKVTLQTGAEVITNLMQINQDLSAQLSTLRADSNALEDETQALRLEIDQIETETDSLHDQADLNQSQKYYLADALDWYSQQYIFRDIGYLVDKFAVSTGNAPPASCEIAGPDRYQRWASTTSRMYEVTPEKMGWTPYKWIRENVLFGSDHQADEPNYIGSLGYEWRYPLVAGSWPFQEVHTTINVYTDEPKSESTENAVQSVGLDCEIQGAIFVANDDAQTKRIDFGFGTISANIKLKYFYGDLNEAVPLLIQAANVVIHDFTFGW
jgi:cell division protein FtsB